MSKSIYEEALKESKDFGSFVGLKLDKVNNALEQAQKQEKLLGHYKDLAEVRKELYDLTTNFNPSNKDRMIVLFTQETLVSNIIKELENEINL